MISTLFTFDSCALYICNKKVGPDTPVTLFKKSCFDRKRRRMNSSCHVHKPWDSTPIPSWDLHTFWTAILGNGVTDSRTADFFPHL